MKRPAGSIKLGGNQARACQSTLTVLMNPGFLGFGVTDYATKMRTLHYGAVVTKEPRSEDDTAACRLLGQRLAEWTAVSIHGKKDEHPAKKKSHRLGAGESRDKGWLAGDGLPIPLNSDPSRTRESLAWSAPGDFALRFVLIGGFVLWFAARLLNAL